MTGGTLAAVPSPDLVVADLGSVNARSVYRDLLRFGPRSRSELTARLQLSAPTVTRVTRDLLDTGRLQQLSATVRAKGRPHEPLDIEENLGPRFIGVKVTADEIHLVVTTVRGNTLEELVLPVEDPAPGAVVEAVAAPVLALAEAHPRLVGVGVSLGGVVADRRTVVSATYLGWDDPIELKAVLEARLGLSVVIENDLVAMVSGLHWFGVGRAYSSFTVLTLGAGVGAATVIDDRMITGRHHLAGQTGRFPIGRTADGAPLMLRDVASTDQIVRRARETGAIGPGEGIDELRRLIAEHDPAALVVAQDLSGFLAAAAAGMVALVDPEALVLGGEGVDLVRAADPVFDRSLREQIAPAQRDLVVRRLSGDFDEWARGAAVIAIQEFVGAVR